MTTAGQQAFWPIRSSETPRYAGTTSFFRLPILSDPGAIDIALLGLPYDGGTTNRAGTRHGPREVRTQSTLLRPFHHVTGRSPYEHCRVADLGDAPVNPLDIDASLHLIEHHYAGVVKAGATPLTVGGDHLVTLPILRAVARQHPVGLIQFDAHADVNDSYFGGSRYTHGTHVRRAVEEGLIDPARIVQIGIRGTRYAPDGIDFCVEKGIRTIHIEEFHSLGTHGTISEIRRIVGNAPVYVTFDIDGVDPAYAPGTGTPEIGGFSSFEAQQMLRGLSGLDIVGGDLVEVSPPFDPLGTTALVGATLLFELLAVTADAVAARRSPT